MTAIWRWIISVLVWLSADPHVINEESPKSAAAVAIAYASLATEPDADTKPVKPVGPVTVPPCPTGNCPVKR